jgi:hypothetical protein
MTTQAELTDFSHEVWRRIGERFDGLSDDEYLWEPVDGCWSIRRQPDGTWLSDGAPERLDHEPFTTIAWRLWHLIDMYGENRAPTWLGVPPQGDAVGLDDPNGAPPPKAAEALVLLERAHARWDAHLALAHDELLEEQIGPVAGPWADASKAAYVLHMLDEFVHHGAEISLLRDLWYWTQSTRV